MPANQELPRKKEKPIIVSAARSIVGSYSEATSIKFDPHVSGGAYQNVRKVTAEWNAKPKHWCLPEFRRRKHPTVTQRPFSPPSFPARRKRRGRRRRVRNDHDGTNPCKQGFLSSVLVSSFPNRKLNLRFGFFLCKSATTSQSRLRRASSHARGALFIPPAAALSCAADNIRIPSHLPAPTQSGSPPRCRPRRPTLSADTPAPRARRAR